MNWRNVREGSAYLLVSDDGRFVIKRTPEPPFTYEVEDLAEGRVATTDTLQGARRKAIAWST